MTCDEVFCMYLREICKNVNENYYKHCLRFILLYRECINETGWLKRRETFKEVGMLNEDSLLANLKTQEEQQEQQSKQALGGLRPSEVPLAPYMVDIDNLDFGDLCPKFNVQGQDADLEAPRKPSGVGIAQKEKSEENQAAAAAAAAAKKSQSPTSKKGDVEDSKSKQDSKQDKEDAKMSS